MTETAFVFVVVFICFFSGSGALPSPRPPILHCGPTTLIHRFPPPVSNTLSPHQHTRSHALSTLWSHLAGWGQDPSPLEDNGMKAREKAVTTQTRLRGFQRETRTLCRTYTHTSFTDTQCAAVQQKHNPYSQWIGSSTKNPGAPKALFLLKE